MTTNNKKHLAKICCDYHTDFKVVEHAIAGSVDTKTAIVSKYRPDKIKDIDAERHPEEQMVETTECDLGYSYLG